MPMAIEGAYRTGRKLVIAGGWRPVSGGWCGSGRGRWRGKGEMAVRGRCLGCRRSGMNLRLNPGRGAHERHPIIGTHRGSLPEIVSVRRGRAGGFADELVAIAERIT
jgi:hypothetical protein